MDFNIKSIIIWFDQTNHWKRINGYTLREAAGGGNAPDRWLHTAIEGVEEYKNDVTT